MSETIRTPGGAPLVEPAPLAGQSWPQGVTPLLSICCVTYNHERFIRECLDGFLMQRTTFPVEVLIYDDASTDGTARIVLEYAARFPQLILPICQSENQYSKQGRPNVRFNFPRARGRYIAICEGDDFWADPRQLQTQVEFLESNPEYVLCYHDARVIDETGIEVLPSRLPASCKRDFSSEELQKCAWTLTLTRCFRNVLAELPPEIDRVLNVDSFLTVLLGKHGRGKYLAQIRPAAYRLHAGSIWSSLDRESQALENLNSVLQIYQYHLRETGQAFARQFLLEVVAYAIERVDPERNPIVKRLRERNRLIHELRVEASRPIVRVARYVDRLVRQGFSRRVATSSKS